MFQLSELIVELESNDWPEIWVYLLYPIHLSVCMQYYTGKKDCASKKCASWPGSQEQGTWAHAINATDARKEVTRVCDFSIQYVL